MVNTSQGHQLDSAPEGREHVGDYLEAQNVAKLTRLYTERPELKTEIEAVADPNISVEERFALVHEFNSKHSEGRQGVYETVNLDTDDSRVLLKFFKNGSMSISIGRKD